MKAGNAGRPARGVPRKGDLSSEYLRVVLLHALHHPGLENGGIGEIGDEIGRLLAGRGGLLVADTRMGGIAPHRTGRAGNN